MKDKKKTIKRLWLRLKIRLYALSRIFCINIGSEIRYQGEEYVVCNGVRSGKWRLEPSGLLSDSGWVSRSECKKVISWRNLRQTYKFFVEFYGGYWLEIWVNADD